MAIARFDIGLDMRQIIGDLMDGMSLGMNFVDNGNLTVAALGLTTTTYSDALTFFSNGAPSPLYLSLYGDDMTFSGTTFSGGSFKALHLYDGSDLNNYISGFTLDATAINLLLGGDGEGFVRAMLSGSDKITLRTGTASNYVIAGTGSDTVDGAAGQDIVYGEAGHDVLYGRDGRDKLFGGIGNDQLNGGTGIDTLQGGDGQDALLGLGAADRIYGGRGVDTLSGGAGNDTLTGGAGADNFDFLLSSGNDVITDFQDGIDIMRIDVPPDSTVSLTFLEKGDDVLVKFGTTQILVLNAEVSQITQADFVLI